LAFQKGQASILLGFWPELASLSRLVRRGSDEDSSSEFASAAQLRPFLLFPRGCEVDKEVSVGGLMELADVVAPLPEVASLTTA
jgi:hypothetical protein